MPRWKIALFLFTALMFFSPIIYNSSGWNALGAAWAGAAVVIFGVLIGGNGPNDTFTLAGDGDGGFDGGGDGGGGD